MMKSIATVAMTVALASLCLVGESHAVPIDAAVTAPDPAILEIRSCRQVKLDPGCWGDTCATRYVCTPSFDKPPWASSQERSRPSDYRPWRPR